MRYIPIELWVCAALFAGIVGFLIGFQYWNESAKCQTIHRITDAPVDVTLNAGCLVKIDGRWLTIEAATSNAHDITVKQADINK